MKNHTLLKTNLIISVIILVGFFITIYTNYNTFKKILEDDIENISKLTCSTIYAEIDNELTKPIFVSQTMANDTFLKTWLQEEMQKNGEAQYDIALQNYLEALRKKYNYDSVFLVSANSNVYYHFQGINKIVSKENKHDIWYYQFLESNKIYDLDVDFDEANNNALTVFVNCRVEDSEGKLMGVVGVGVQMNQLQQILNKYETEYNLQAILINFDGLIQVHTDTNQIEKTTLFDSPAISPFKQSILNNKTGMEINWLIDNNKNYCLISRYIQNLDWYLVVEKNTDTIKTEFNKMVYMDLTMISFIILLLLCLSTLIIRKFNQIIMHLANTDELTALPNLSAFKTKFIKHQLKAETRCHMLFFFDIDNFKQVNDKSGHVVGNQVLFEVGQLSKKIIGENGLLARFGGDEFIGVLWCDTATAIMLLDNMLETVRNKIVAENISVTLSVGAAYILESSDLDSIMTQADDALYASKRNGKNQVTIYSCPTT